MIAAYVNSNSDVAALAEHASRSRSRITRFALYDDFCDGITAENIVEVICDVDDWPERALEFLNQRLKQVSQAATIYFVHGCSPRAIDNLQIIAQNRIQAHTIFRRYHALAKYFDQRSHGIPYCATLPILGMLGLPIRSERSRIFTACVMCAERRITEVDLCRQIGMGSKRLQATLRECGLPDFRSMMALLRISHALYRIEVHGMNIATSAALSGFSSTRDFEQYVRRNTSITPRQWVTAYGHNVLLQVVSQWFNA